MAIYIEPGLGFLPETLLTILAEATFEASGYLACLIITSST